ncbi:MAG: protein kinase [Myxococcota bacterium]
MVVPDAHGPQSELDDRSQDVTLPQDQDTAISGADIRTGDPGPETTEDPLLSPGDTLGRFSITRVLGQGGMGVVYAARDPDLGRELAVKVLHRSVDDADERARARLLREARAMASVSHPNLVTVYDVGRHEGQVFIAMELVRGQTLGQWQRSEPHDWREVLRMYHQAAQGLVAAHEDGLVHRDFKPSNVLVSTKGRVQVVDFGLARAVSTGDAVQAVQPSPADAIAQADREALATDLTRTGALAGTPAYMASEQFRGEATDARTDQFAFCVALWEGLFGERPFAGATPVALMLAVIEDERRAAPTETEVPPRIIEALERGLASDPGRRFADMSALLEQLRVESEPTATPTMGSPWRWLGAAALVGVAGLGLYLAMPSKPADPVPQTPPPEQTEPTPAVEPPKVGLAAIDGYTTRKNFRSTATLWEAAARDFQRACEATPDHARWCAAWHFSQGQTLLERHEPAAAEAPLNKAASIDPKWALPHLGLAGAYRLQGRFDDALEASIVAQGLAPDLWLTVSSAASTHVAAERLDEAIDEYLRALELAPEQPDLLASLALVYHAHELDSQAERYANKALEKDPESMPALMLLAERGLEAGDGATALAFADRAVAVGPQSVSAWLARGDALLLLDRKTEAQTCLTRAVQLLSIDKDHGAPAERLERVQQALLEGETPPPRYGEGAVGKLRSRKAEEEPESPAPVLQRSRKAKPAKKAKGHDADDPFGG